MAEGQAGKGRGHKRGNGEGSIYQREDGRWEARVSLDGKRRSVYGKTRREVQQKLAELKRQEEQGLLVGSDRQTLGAFLSDWLESTARPTIRPATYANYRVYVRNHIVPGLGHYQLGKLTPQHVQGWLNDLSAAGLAPKTVRDARAVLRRALNQAVKWSLVARNVAALVEPPKSARFEVAGLAPEDAQRLLAAVRGDRLEALYVLTLSCGLRQGEVLGLHWQDVDFERRELRVRLGLQRNGGRLRFVEPKTPQSRRVIALPEGVVAPLREHRKRQLEERLRAGDIWPERCVCGCSGGVVFTSEVGTPIDPRNLVRHFHRVRTRAGFPALRFHDLRHGCATLLLAKGTHPKLVQELLGHSRVSMTLDTYSHVTPVMRREVADTMDGLLRTALG